MKKTLATKITSALLCAVTLLGIILAFASCGKEESTYALVNKSDLGLNFAVYENYKRTYLEDVDIEYTTDDGIGFYVDLIPYDAYQVEEGVKLSYGADIKTCTQAIIDKMKFPGVEISYDPEKKTARFDMVAAVEEGGASCYNYIVVLLSQRGIFVARYACPATEDQIQMYVSGFEEMAKHLSVVDP